VCPGAYITDRQPPAVFSADALPIMISVGDALQKWGEAVVYYIDGQKIVAGFHLDQFAIIIIFILFQS
jgi:hypothetical protein